MSPFTVWQCPVCREPIHVGRVGESLGDSQFVVKTGHWHDGANHPAIEAPLFSAEEIRERLLSKGAREAAHRASMKKHSFHPYDEITETLFDTAVDAVFPQGASQ